jgi:hypothetical protein
MSESHCICSTIRGDAYYCPVHGGNGSWAGLLVASITALENCWDPSIARQVRQAAQKLPEDHSLRQRAEDALSAQRPAAN